MKTSLNFLEKRNLLWRRFLCFIILLTSLGDELQAQTTIATTLANNNGSSVVIGNLYNSNLYPIVINSIQSATSFAGTQTAELWTKQVAGANIGAPGAVSVANGWTLQSSQSVVTVSTATTGAAAQTVLSGLNITLDANSYYLFCVSMSTSISYSTVGTQTCSFSGGGVTLTYCATNGYGGTLASPSNTPRGLVGAITFSPAVACTGLPSPGNTLATSTSVCPGQSIVLSLQNSQGTGTLYQWHNSSGPITAATNSTYTASPTTAETYYCEVTCTNSGLSANSTPISTTMSGFLTCYCIPTTTNGCASGDHITNVTFTSNGNPINNTTGVCLNASYSDYTTSIGTAQVTQGDFVPVVVSVNNGGTEYAGAWIDYDQSGTFDAIEYIPLTDADGIAPWIYTGTASIPVLATLGLTRMRFRSSYNAVISPTSACLTYSFGETEDYYVNIALTGVCSGVPAPGNTIASVSDACVGEVVNFSLQNFTPGLGVTYQWNNNAGPILAATNSTYSQAMTIADDFYCDVTCGTSTTSSGLVTVNIKSFIDCYCNSIPTQTADEEIFNVTLNGNSTDPAYANSNGCTTVAPGPGSLLSRYSNFKTLGSLANLMVGAPSPFEVRENECDGATYYANGIGIWIDYNHNGSFNDPGEDVYIEGTTSAATGLSPAGDKIIAGMITPPFSATLGPTVMRVISAEGFSGSLLTPCLAYGYGETEDYLITLIANSVCSGTPAPGNTLASALIVCPNTTVNLSLQNFTSGSGITYQWFNSSGIIPNATNSTYVATITATETFYSTVTCANGGAVGSSVPVTITLDNYTNCYCPAGATAIGCTTGDEYIGNFMFATINNTSTCPASGQYSNFSTITTCVTMGETYTASVLIPNWFAGDQASVWIDFDHDGILNDATEQFPLTIGGGDGTTPLSGSILIPNNAQNGLTKMRVRANYLGSMSSCGVTSFGEVEDYMVDIKQPVILNLKCFIECFMTSPTTMQPVLFNQGVAPYNVTLGPECDFIAVDLRESSTNNKVASVDVILNQDGTAVCKFPYCETFGLDCYIAVRHRNALLTCSKLPLTIGLTNAYDFTDAVSKAYGDNQAQVYPNVYAFYSGDLDQNGSFNQHDENIELIDLGILENAINNFASGNVPEDLNGDGNVDLSDYCNIESNISNFIFSQHPTPPVLW